MRGSRGVGTPKCLVVGTEPYRVLGAAVFARSQAKTCRCFATEPSRMESADPVLKVRACS